MLKYCLHYEDEDEFIVVREFTLPHKPQKGDFITIGTDYHSVKYVVEEVETFLDTESVTYRLNVHLGKRKE